MTETKSENEAQPVPQPEFFPRQPPRVIIPEELGTIRTRRLILRPLALSDAEDIFEHRRLQAVADWLCVPCLCYTQPYPTRWKRRERNNEQEDTLVD
jgi:hypothetical protein